MAPDIRKAAEHYVKQHVKQLDTKVPAKDVRQAIRKVADALEEVRAARAEAERIHIDLK